MEKVRALPPQKRDEVLKFADSLCAEADADEAEERARLRGRSRWVNASTGRHRRVRRIDLETDRVLLEDLADYGVRSVLVEVEPPPFASEGRLR